MKNLEQVFKDEPTFSRKLIYVFRINDKVHKGLLKIGEATLNSNLSDEDLKPSSRILNQSARKRIDSYTKTAGIEYDLIYTELAVKTKIKNGKKVQEAFRDYDVHRVLINSGIEKKQPIKNTGNEWFKTDLETVKNAISAVKKDEKTLTPDKISIDNNPIVLRPEQCEAIEKAIKIFKRNDRMLWNAKMRFGKTLCALEVVKRMNFEKSIIVTHRPVVNKGWHTDFNIVFKDSDEYVYLDKTSKDDFNKYLKSGYHIIYFCISARFKRFNKGWRKI